MNYILFLSIILPLAITACDKENMEGSITIDPGFADELRASPERIGIDGNNLILETYLWRDFMPPVEKDGRPLICINKLTEADSLPIATGISLRKQYVIKGNQIWAARHTEVRDHADHVLEGVVRDGPKWGPDIDVDVVCEFEFRGNIYRIIARSQPIHTTW